MSFEESWGFAARTQMEEDIIQAAAAESQGAQGAQGQQGPPRPGSRRTQFLRNVSLFSAAHQLAVLEVREEQGVSLLERSTSLTAEPLDEQGLPTGRSLSLPGPDGVLDGDRPGRTTRSCSLATTEPPRKPSRPTQTRASRRRSSVAASSRTPSSRGSRGSKTSRASRDSKASRDSRKASKDSRKASRDSRRVSRDSRRASRASRTSRVSGSRRPSTIVAAQATPRPSLARSTSKVPKLRINLCMRIDVNPLRTYAFSQIFSPHPLVRIAGRFAGWCPQPAQPAQPSLGRLRRGRASGPQEGAPGHRR